MLSLPSSVLEMSRMSTQEMGQQRNPKSSTVFLEGATRTPAVLLVFLCAYHVTRISPLGRLDRTRH